MLIAFTTLSFAQCGHLTRGITEIWGDFPIEYGKLINDYDDSTGVTLPIQVGDTINIFWDLGDKIENTDITYFLKFKYVVYQRKTGKGNTYYYEEITTCVSTSEDNVNYKRIDCEQLNPENNSNENHQLELFSIKRYLKLSFYTYKSAISPTNARIDSIKITESILWSNIFKHSITQIGTFYKVGDKVKLFANIPLDYKQDYLITWHSTTLPKEGVIGDSIEVNSPGNYYFEYVNNKWGCSNISETHTVKKEINEVQETKFSENEIVKYYDILGREIVDLNYYSGYYLELHKFKESFQVNKKYK